MAPYRQNSSLRGLLAGLLPVESRNDFRLMWLSNFEAERFWTSGNAVQLPKFSQPQDVAMVNRLEEMTLFLAEYPDAVIMRERSDPGFLDYLTALGYRLPAIVAVNPPDKQTAISEALLANRELCDQLSGSSPSGADFFLMPYARTRLEENIIRRIGFRSVGSSAAVCEKINSKIYSRTVSKELGLRTIEGWECDSIESLEQAFNKTAPSSQKKYVLKESMGVSGKGLFIADSAARAGQVMALLRRKAKGEAQFGFVLERWVDKLKDINYQVFISASGDVELLALKEILTENGVHMGHRFPAALTDSQIDCYNQAAQAIGKRLFADGYVGIAGIDSIIDRKNRVYPLLEINARFNMSTYQLGLDRLLEPGTGVRAKYYPLLLRARLSFDYLADAIAPDLLRNGRGYGVLIQNFATVNANCDSGAEPFKGRLYVLLIGSDLEVSRLDRMMIERLNTLQCRN